MDENCLPPEASTACVSRQSRTVPGARVIPRRCQRSGALAACTVTTTARAHRHRADERLHEWVQLDTVRPMCVHRFSCALDHPGVQRAHGLLVGAEKISERAVAQGYPGLPVVRVRARCLDRVEAGLLEVPGDLFAHGLGAVPYAFGSFSAPPTARGR